jgi:hypothetical protein
VAERINRYYFFSGLSVGGNHLLTFGGYTLGLWYGLHLLTNHI